MTELHRENLIKLLFIIIKLSEDSGTSLGKRDDVRSPGETSGTAREAYESLLGETRFFGHD